MGFLTPLYIAGILGVSLPLLFHLIRRTPRGRTAFSSLMFLEASPPRLTRRSRLDHLLLLLLRALALILLALAFARPFLREASLLGWSAGDGKRAALLLDVSASMRRGTLWRRALEEAEKQLQAADPDDRFALYVFDEDVYQVVGFEDWEKIPPEQALALIRAKLRELSPSWAATDLGASLTKVADTLDGLSEASLEEVDASLQIVLISDLQSGAKLEKLQQNQWPDNIWLTLVPIMAERETNAGAQWIAVEDSVDASPEDVQQRRLRIRNSSRSSNEQFWLSWDTEDDDDPQRMGVYVPPGESRVVKAPSPPPGVSPERLLLLGDDHAFDNTLHLAPQKQQQIRVVYWGKDAAEDSKEMLYYLQRAFPETPRRRFEIVSQPLDQPLLPLETPALAIVAEPLPEKSLASFRRYLENGGMGLAVMRDLSLRDTLAELLENEQLEFQEQKIDDYALFGEIDFGHALFAPFAHPRYNDFTKIHFWKHRRGKNWDSQTHAAARFDNGAGAVMERRIKRGLLTIFTSSWRPDDSQLALSSKFVPMLSVLLERGAGSPPAREYFVNDAIPLMEKLTAEHAATLHRPDGAQVKLAVGQTFYRKADVTGAYRLDSPAGEQLFAVNIRPSESRTEPLENDEFSKRGVRLGRPETRRELEDKERQLRTRELERKQKMWRWMIAAVLGVLLLETWLAGRYAKQQVSG